MSLSKQRVMTVREVPRVTIHDVSESPHVTPVKSLHMLFVLLMGIDHDLDSNECDENPRNPTLLWSAIKDANHNPVRCANPFHT